MSLGSKNADEEGLKSIVGGSWGVLLGSGGVLVKLYENPGHFFGIPSTLSLILLHLNISVGYFFQIRA